MVQESRRTLSARLGTIEPKVYAAVPVQLFPDSPVFIPRPIAVFPSPNNSTALSLFFCSFPPPSPLSFPSLISSVANQSFANRHGGSSVIRFDSIGRDSISNGVRKNDLLLVLIHMEGKVESRAPYLTSRDFETTWTKILPERFVAAAVKRSPPPPPFERGEGRISGRFRMGTLIE